MIFGAKKIRISSIYTGLQATIFWGETTSNRQKYLHLVKRSNYTEKDSENIFGCQGQIWVGRDREGYKRNFY